MDLVLRNVRLVDGDAVVIADIGVADGRIAEKNHIWLGGAHR